MNRDELLEKLQSITFFAHLTDLTTEGCYEVVILTGDGARDFLIGYDEWNVYYLESIEENQWKNIRRSLELGTLSKRDIDGTDLLSLYEAYNNPCSVNAFFESLKSLPPDNPGDFYCIYNNPELSEEGEDNLGSSSKPVFYAEESSLLSALKGLYKYMVTGWDAFDTEVLESWYEYYERYSCEGMVYTYFN